MRGSAIIPFVFAFQTALSLPFEMDVGPLDVDFDTSGISGNGGVNVEVNGQPVEDMGSPGDNVFEWSTVIGGSGGSPGATGGFPSVQYSSAPQQASTQVVSPGGHYTTPAAQGTTPAIQYTTPGFAGGASSPAAGYTSPASVTGAPSSAAGYSSPAVQSATPGFAGGASSPAAGYTSPASVVVAPSSPTGNPAPASSGAPLFTPTGVASGSAPAGSHYAGEVEVNNGIATLWVAGPSQSHYAGEIEVHDGIATLWVAPSTAAKPTGGPTLSTGHPVQTGPAQQPTTKPHTTASQYTPPYTPPVTTKPPVTTQPPKTSQQPTTTKPPTPTTTQATNPNLNGDQQSAAALHDQYRSQMGVGGIAWDANLAASAQAYASQLASTNTFEHSSGDQRPNQGENLYMAGAATEWTWDSSGTKSTDVTKEQSPYTAAAKGWTAGELNAFNVNYTACGSKIPCACENAGELFESFGHFSESS